jgi:hypothetical protein
MAIPASGADTWLTINGQPLGFQPGNDNLAAATLEFEDNELQVTAHAPRGIEIWIEGERLRSGYAGYWLWRPKAYAGLYEITIKTPSQETYTASVRVLPGQLSLERYEQMLDDISVISEDLLYQLHAPAYERAKVRSQQGHSSALREYQLIKAIQPSLADVMANIRRSPWRTLVGRTDAVLLHQVRRFSGEVQPVPGPMLALAGSASGILQSFPQIWNVQESVLTYDTYENRLLKHFLWRQLQPRIYSIQEKAQAEIRRREQLRRFKLQQGWSENETRRINELQEVVDDCQVLMNQCIAWGSEVFLKDVRLLVHAQEPTQVLQKHPYYNRFYRIYLRYQRELGFDLNSERFVARLAMRKMSELYETWSMFVITNVVIKLLDRRGYKVISSSGFFGVDEDQFNVEVDRQARIELSNGLRRINLRYEPLYPPATSVTSGMVSNSPSQRTPDLSIEVWERNQPIAVIIFDAKYGTQRDGDSYSYYEDDLYKMSDYLQKICWKANDSRQRYPHKVVTSAYIVYPGTVIQHDPEQPETGALPLVPNAPDRIKALNAIKDILKNANL